MTDVSVPFAVGSEQATVVLPVDLPTGGDETAALQALIDATPDGTAANPNVLDLNDRIWRVDGELKVYQRNHLAVENGKIDGTRHVGATNSRHLLIWSSNHVTVRNVEVEGAHSTAGAPTYNAWVGPNGEDWHGHHAFAIMGSDDVTLDSCIGHHTYADGIYVGWHDPGPTPNIPSTNIKLLDCIVYKTGRQGICPTAVSGLEITAGSVAEARAWLIDIEPNQTDVPSENITIDGVLFPGPHRLGVMSCSGPGSIGNFRNISLLNSRSERTASSSWPVVYAISPAGHPARSGLTVTGNNFVHNNPARPWADVTGWVNTVLAPNTITTS